jgi:hypothetical protein
MLNPIKVSFFPAFRDFAMKIASEVRAKQVQNYNHALLCERSETKLAQHLAT